MQIELLSKIVYRAHVPIVQEWMTIQTEFIGIVSLIIPRANILIQLFSIDFCHMVVIKKGNNL